MKEQYECMVCGKLITDDEGVTTLNGLWVCDNDSCRTLDEDNEATEKEIRITDKKSYLLCNADDSEFYIPDALHIERNDELMLVDSDEQASIEAERDGVSLIYGMDGVPDRVYVDTDDNRNIITNALAEYPEYYNVHLVESRGL